MTPRPADERGSLAIEYVIVAPLFLMVIGLILAFARVSQLDGLLDAGTRDAARAVSEMPDLNGDVQKVVDNAVKGELQGGSGNCDQDSVSVKAKDVSPSGAVSYTHFSPGDTVIVTSTCMYSLSALGLPVPMPDMRATSVFASVIDPNRSRG